MYITVSCRIESVGIDVAAAESDNNVNEMITAAAAAALAAG